MPAPATSNAQNFVPQVGPHSRVPWVRTDPKLIHVHARFAEMKGTHGQSEKQGKEAIEKYNRAKSNYSVEDAFDIVDRLMKNAHLDAIAKAVISAGMPALVVAPLPGFHDDDACEPVTGKPTNALPFAFARRIADDMDCDVDEAVIQSHRPGRTSLGKFPRYLWQPHFEGAVRTDRAYIIADDVCTNGGTIAMLRTHIVANGGTVVAATTLGHTDGKSQLLPIESGTQSVLMSLYGAALDAFWTQEVGHEIQCLTNGEGVGLVEWSRENVPRRNSGVALQQLRDRFAKARGTCG